jgi:hypothetical protein
VRWLFPHGAAAAALLLVLALAALAPAQAEDGDEGEPGAPPDTGAGRVETPRLGEPARTRAASRPNYKLVFKRDRDSSSWDHTFGLRYSVSDRVTLQAGSSIVIRETDALNRVNRQERWNAALDVGVTSAITMAVKLDRTSQSDVRSQGSSGEVRSFREKETADLSTTYSKTMLSGVTTTLGMTAGLERNKYADVRSRGSAQTISASVGYSPTPALKGNLNYSGRHSLLDSEQGALRSSDESVSQTMGADVGYTWAKHAFNVTMNRSTSVNEYPKEEQKERREQENRNSTANATLKLLPDMDLTLGYDYSRSRSSYALDPERDNEISGRTVSASLNYAFAGVRVTSQLSSDAKRNEYYNEQTGDTYGKTLSITATRDFGTRLTATMNGRTTLYSHHFDDIEDNDQDRDLYDQEATLKMDYRIGAGISTGLSLRVREDQLIYIRRTRTGDNKTAQTYSVQPFITKALTRSMSVTQRYDLSADYTFYTFDEDRNFLIRNLGVTTEFRWSGLSSLDVTLSHRYLSQDEGSYVTGADGVARYGKRSERDDHALGITVKCKLFDEISLEASQEFTVQQKWSVSSGERRLSWERHDARLTGKAAVDYALANGTTLKVSVARTDRDATNIVEQQRRAWDISVSIDKTF